MEKTNEELQLRIRELEKEIAKLHTQIKKERYGLVWLDVPEGFEQESENQIPVLEEVKDKAIKNDDGKPTHIIIEGDNYHALTCLNYTHKGKIDVIYIDPPYNTGSDGFTYKDKRFLKEFPDGSPVPKDHPLRHSYWLSFMSKRLELAKNLLSDKGVIFISIDDNEQANLKLLCDKIFGEVNFAANIIWEKADSPRMDAKDFSSKHDYIIVYCKNYASEPFNKIKTKSVADHYNKVDNNGMRYYLKPLRYMGNADSRSDRPNMYYGIEAPDGSMVYPIKSDGTDGRWRWGYEKFVKEQNRLEFTKSKNGWSVYTKIFADEENEIPIETIWYNQDVESNRNAIAIIKKIFGEEKVFSNPKPILLLERIIQIASKKSSIILDFFAGSGTTLHATMKLNAEDGGNRQCILVQQSEGDKNICEQVTYERNKRVINGYTNAKGETIEGLGNSLKYYRTAFVGKNPPRRATDYDKTELSKKAGCLLALAENTLEEIEVSNSYQIFSDGKNHYTGVYFTGRLTEIETFTQKLEDIRNQNRRIKITAYFFCWGDCAQFEDEFSNLERISLQPIPKPILDIYQSINR